MDKELKPCPFCGGEARLMHIDYIGDNYVDNWAVHCASEDCECQPDTCMDESRDKIIKAWNTRVNDNG